MIQLTKDILEKLAQAGLEVLRPAGAQISDNITFEPPCSIKWMNIQHGLRLGAFSYAVRGFYSNTEIGRYTSIGEDVQVGRGDHPTRWLSTSPAFYQQPANLFRTGTGYAGGDAYKAYAPKLPPGKRPTELKLTKIGHDVYIGHGAFIRPGVTIGHGAIVAGRAVVVKDVPPYAVVAGNPAAVKKYRFAPEIIAVLLALEWWRFAPWQLQGIDFTEPEKSLSMLERICPKLTPYAPGEKSVKQFAPAP